MGSNPNRFLRATACVVEIRGGNGRHFTTLALLLSRLSAPIEALVKGIIEGTNASASIDINDEGLFYCFCQFMFTGSYNRFTKPDNKDRDYIKGIALSIAGTYIKSMKKSVDTKLTNFELFRASGALV